MNGGWTIDTTVAKDGESPKLVKQFFKKVQVSKLTPTHQTSGHHGFWEPWKGGTVEPNF